MKTLTTHQPEGVAVGDDVTLDTLVAPGSATADWIWRNGSLQRWEDATVHVRAVGHSCVSAVFEGI